jgi:SAM-dependent methyltransferase
MRSERLRRNWPLAADLGDGLVRGEISEDLGKDDCATKPDHGTSRVTGHAHWPILAAMPHFGTMDRDDFVRLARERVVRDPDLDIDAQAAEAMFLTLDVEKQTLPSRERFDAAILESCLHHFVDPISALSHIRDSMKEDGLVVVIEGENRQDEIKKEYLKVMADYDTLERPLKRAHLLEVLEMTGLGHYEFLAPVNGFFSQSDPRSQSMTEIIAHTEAAMNICVCAKNEPAMGRIFPWRNR